MKFLEDNFGIRRSTEKGGSMCSITVPLTRTKEKSGTDSASLAGDVLGEL